MQQCKIKKKRNNNTSISSTYFFFTVRPWNAIKSKESKSKFDQKNNRGDSFKLKRDNQVKQQY